MAQERNPGTGADRIPRHTPSPEGGEPVAQGQQDRQDQNNGNVDNRPRIGKRAVRIGGGILTIGALAAAGYYFWPRGSANSETPITPTPRVATASPSPRPADVAKPIGSPEAKPVASEIPQEVVNTVVRTAKTILKPQYYGMLPHPESTVRDSAETRIRANTRRVAISTESIAVEVGKAPEAQKAELRDKLIAQQRDLQNRPRYSTNLRSELPFLSEVTVAPRVEADYKSAANLQDPTRVEFYAQLPLRSIPEAGVVTPQTFEGRTIDTIDISRVGAAVRAVVDLTQVEPGTFKGQIEGNRWRGEGTMTDGSKLRIVGAPDGRFGVRITKPDHQARPGDEPRIGVPAFPAVEADRPAAAPSPVASPRPGASPSPKPSGR